MKSILVHIDASPRSAERVAIAQRLARRHGAELTAVYAVLPTMLATPWVAGEGMASAAAVMAERDRVQRAHARATFEQAAARGPVLWAESEGEAAYWTITQRAFLADLVVLGQHDPSDAETGALPPDFVPSLVTDAGRPALVVPYAGSFESEVGHVLVAWKPTREAARALTAALPWLLAARRVHLASRREGKTPDEGPFIAIEHWLRLHGVQGQIAHHDLGEIDVGEGLLSLASDTAADLLVMGCYGHSRAREWVLGGATRTVLKSMTVPVLMAH